MQKGKQLVPKLRFSEFTENITVKKLKDIAKVKRGAGSQYINYVSEKVKGSIRLIRIGDFLNSAPVWIELNEAIKRFILKENDILIAGTGATAGITFKVPDNFIGLAYSYNAPKISCTKEASASFLIQCLKSPIITNQQRRLFTGNAQPFLDTKAINNFKIGIPTLQEQQKIANFLTAVDNQIQTLEKKKTLLEQYKKGVMQKIFKQELRFKDDDGNAFAEWKKLQLTDIAERVKTKNKIDNQNVLTISAQLGLVSQLEYFNKSVSAKNLTGYYLLEKNDFAYNKSYSKGYPMGAIKRLNKYDLGVVSTLYICFRFNKKVSLDFMEQYFDAGLQNREIEKVAQEGARNHGLLNIGVNDFFEIDLKIPSLEEQTKIANFLSAIDKNIALVNTKIEHTKAYKKGLLQQMFV